jgi:hypothetical protein
VTRTLPLSLLLLTICSYGEDTPAPPPAPVTPTSEAESSAPPLGTAPLGTTPTEAAPTEAAPNEAAPLGTAPLGVAPKTPEPLAIPAPSPSSAQPTPSNVAASVASNESRSWSGFTALVGGWDSNVLLQPSNRPNATDERSAVLGGEMRLSWHALRTATGRLDVSADGDHTAYPSSHEADLSRAGVRAFGQLTVKNDTVGRIDPGLLVGAHRYWLSGEGAATSLMATGMITKVKPTWVGVATVGVVNLDYDNNSSASGSLFEMGYRHLFLLRDSDSRRNVELSLRGGGYYAESKTDNYATITGSCAGAWRFGERQAVAGTFDVNLRLSYELRSYDHPNNSDEQENQAIFRAGSQAAWWLSRQINIGPYAVFSQRNSNIDVSDFDRFQVGLRLEAAF